MAEDGGTFHSQTMAAADAAPVDTSRSLRLRDRLPRLELVILVLGLLSLAYVKLTRLAAAAEGDILTTAGIVLPSDVAICAFVIAAIYSVYALWPSKWAARITLVFSLIVGAWSMANAAWIQMVCVQLHVDVVGDLLANPREIGPIVTNRLFHSLGFTLALAAVVIPPTLAVCFRLWRPRPIRLPRRSLALRALASTLLGAGCLVFGRASSSWVEAAPELSVLSYSSHWLALQSLLGRDGSTLSDDSERAALIARAGERELPFVQKLRPQPHVVLIILESAAYWATSFGEQPPECTPTLTALAKEGALFEKTRSVVPRTTQDQFAMLTGCYPSLCGGFSEAVPVEKPYESLATILARSGYRSRFSQMSRGRFDCVPGFVANLGFDSFWSQEDLGDPSAYLGYLAGDDTRMIEPAFEWFDRQTSPCLLVFMTSISHEPFELPSWYAPTPNDPKEAFLATIHFTDRVVQTIVDELTKRTRPEDLLLCVLADHGDGLGRNGVRLRISDPYDGTLRIPWIIRWPGHVQPGAVVKQPCSVLDVTPTILSLLGYGTSDAGFDGQDALSPDLPSRRLAFFGWRNLHPAGFVQGDEKTVYWPEMDKAYRFDLASDPMERNPMTLDVGETHRLRDEVMSMRGRYAIRFSPKRYRHLMLYDRWLTSSLGDMAWCYYISQQ